MNKEFADKFIKCALIRMIRTIAQTAIASIGAAAVIAEVNWITVLSTSALAGLVSLLMSVATGLPEVKMPSAEDNNNDE